MVQVLACELVYRVWAPDMALWSGRLSTEGKP